MIRRLKRKSVVALLAAAAMVVVVAAPAGASTGTGEITAGLFTIVSNDGDIEFEINGTGGPTPPCTNPDEVDIEIDFDPVTDDSNFDTEITNVESGWAPFEFDSTWYVAKMTLASGANNTGTVVDDDLVQNLGITTQIATQGSDGSGNCVPVSVRCNLGAFFGEDHFGISNFDSGFLLGTWSGTTPPSGTFSDGHTDPGDPGGVWITGACNAPFTSAFANPPIAVHVEDMEVVVS